MRQILRLVAFGGAVCFLLGAAGLIGPGWAQTASITATNAWARRAAAMGSMGRMADDDKGGTSHMADGGTSAVYVTLNNTGSQADALVSAASEVARVVELHEVKQESGVMKMRPVTSIPLPAGGTVELKPGGYHLMLLDLKHDLKAAEKVPVTLRFEHGGELRIEAAVR